MNVVRTHRREGQACAEGRRLEFLNQDCVDIVVEFAPTATGAAAGTISIQYDNGATVVTSDRTLQGTGAAPALITISEVDTYDMGSITQGSSTNKIFNINKIFLFNNIIFSLLIELFVSF